MFADIFKGQPVTEFNAPQIGLAMILDAAIVGVICFAVVYCFKMVKESD